MRKSKHTKRFRRDYKRIERSGRYEISKLHKVIDKLLDGIQLPVQYKDHSLKGHWLGCRDCHIEGDWILIYEISIDSKGIETITFHATDNHSNLFK